MIPTKQSATLVLLITLTVWGIASGYVMSFVARELGLSFPEAFVLLGLSCIIGNYIYRMWKHNPPAD